MVQKEPLPRVLPASPLFECVIPSSETTFQFIVINTIASLVKAGGRLLQGMTTLVMALESHFPEVLICRMHYSGRIY